MAALITNQARAYVNWGRWVADCPQDCGGALALEPHQSMFNCPECKVFSAVEWPTDIVEIMDALAERPVPKTRNWYPRSHPLAERFGMPHGQTPQQLREEAMAHGMDNA